MSRQADADRAWERVAHSLPTTDKLVRPAVEASIDAKLGQPHPSFVAVHEYQLALKDLADARDENQSLRERFWLRRSEVAQMSRTIESLREQVSGAPNHREVIARLEGRVSALVEDKRRAELALEQKASEAERIRAERNRLADKYDQVRSSQRALNAEVLQLREERQQLRENMTSAQKTSANQLNELSRLSSENRGLTEKVRLKQKTINGLIRTCREHWARVQHEVEDNRRLRTEVLELAAELLRVTAAPSVDRQKLANAIVWARSSELGLTPIRYILPGFAERAGLEVE